MARPDDPDDDPLLRQRDHLLVGLEHEQRRREVEAMLFGTPIEPVMIGQYRLGAQLDKGGMGSVFEATDEHGEAVAIKFMHAVSGAGARFEREIGILSNLDHPRVVRYIDHGVSEDGSVYLVMERLSGEDLATHLQHTRPSVDACVQLGIGIADALVRAHALGCVHRDIKPRNLFLVDGRMDQVKLVDFGLAQAKHLMPALTTSGVVLGTVGYMAPEQARGSSNIDHRADIFSLGCVLFEALAGVHPFAADNPVKIVANILGTEPPPLRSLNEAVPDSLAQLVHAMLAKRPEQRPASSSVVFDALRSL